MSAFHPLQTLALTDKIGRMRLARPTFIAACAAAIFVAGLFVGLWLNRAPAARDAHPAWTEPQLRDAIRRWSLKSAEPEADARQSRSPRAMFIPIRNQGDGLTCIELELQSGSVGGSPVYCYRNHTNELAAEYSDVE